MHKRIRCAEVPDRDLKPDSTPELRLIAAIIHRAVIDSVQIKPICSTLARPNRHKEGGVLDPDGWIFSNNKSPWSFLWCLSQMYGEASSRYAQKIRKYIGDEKTQKTR